jgi:hypothetical protein
MAQLKSGSTVGGDNVLLDVADSVDASNIAANAVGSSEIADNAITLAKMAHGTDGEIITYDATGAPATVSVGTSGQVLTSNGTGAAPSMQSPAAAGADTSLSNLSSTGENKVCQAWVNFNGTGTVAIRDSHNVSSITDNGTGDYTVNLAQAMGSADYACFCDANGSHLDRNLSFPVDSSSFKIYTTNHWYGAEDRSIVTGLVFGDPS